MTARFPRFRLVPSGGAPALARLLVLHSRIILAQDGAVRIPSPVSRFVVVF